jgi:hypothetical protein
MEVKDSKPTFYVAGVEHHRRNGNVKTYDVICLCATREEALTLAMRTEFLNNVENFRDFNMRLDIGYILAYHFLKQSGYHDEEAWIHIREQCLERYSAIDQDRFNVKEIQLEENTKPLSEREAFLEKKSEAMYKKIQQQFGCTEEE